MNKKTTKKQNNTELDIRLATAKLHVTCTTLHVDSADDKSRIFFYEIRLWHFMQIVSRRQFAWNAKDYFWGKIRKIFQNVVCWFFLPSMESVNMCTNLLNAIWLSLEMLVKSDLEPDQCEVFVDKNL